jgi:hypothetical protein
MLPETADAMTEEESGAFFYKLQAFHYSLTDKERVRFDAILERARISLSGDREFDETVWLAAYAD